MPDFRQVKSEFKPDYDGFFDRVKEAMNLENAPKIAQKLGLEKQSVYGWAKGSLPRVETLVVIAEIGQVSLHWLITGKGPKFISDTPAFTTPNQVLSPSNNGSDRSDNVTVALKSLMREVLVEEGIIEPKRD